MSRLQFLRLTVLLPVVVPVALYVPVFAVAATGGSVPDILGAAAAFSFTAILFFGVPYLLLAAAALFVLRRRSWEAHVKAAIAAPWLMVVAAEVYAFATDSSSTTFSDALTGGVVIAVFTVVLGYIYVALALGGAYALAEHGYLRSAG